MTQLFKIYLSCILIITVGCFKLESTYANSLFPDSLKVPLQNPEPRQTYTYLIPRSHSNISNKLDQKNLNIQAANSSNDPISWDIDKDGNADALTDALLLLRYSFGLTGESLIANALSKNSTLTTTEIETQLAEVLSISDIDADGNVDALTDSLILLRYLFGLTGESLINGSISAGAKRTSATAIEDHISAYMPSTNTNPKTVSIFGNITFDLIPFYQYGDGLNMNSTFTSAARGIMVEALDNNGEVVASNITDNNGRYSFVVIKDAELRLRVSAKMLQQTGTPWNVRVLDNTSSMDGENPLYVTDSSTFFTSQDIVKNIHLPSGRNGTNGGIRSAAPFAILDTIFESMQTLLSVNPTIAFPPLKVYWSSENNTSSGTIEDGDLGSSFFQSPDKIYILGDENSDSDEYDRHVIAHEWIHYFEDNFSRSDSMGGSHSIDDQLDMRVAYSEALANAVSGIINQDSVYKDSNSFWPYFGWSMDMESNYSYKPGWYSENSIQSIIYDLYDSDLDGEDNIALGFGPIFNTLTSPSYINDDYQITIFSFAKYLKDQQSPANIEKINNLMNAQQIFGSGTNGFGETNNGGIASTLPIYRQIYANGTSERVCYNNSAGILNKFGNRSFLLFDVPSTGIYNIKLRSAEQASASLDADLAIYRKGVTIGRDYSTGYNGSANLLIYLSTGKHIIESGVWDQDQVTPVGNYCFNVEITR